MDHIINEKAGRIGMVERSRKSKKISFKERRPAGECAYAAEIVNMRIVDMEEIKDDQRSQT